ncbi:MAG: flavodoxin family protein [Alphaproteobacteria bacterium]
MIKIAVVFFSGYGHTKNQAEAVASGAKALNPDVKLYEISKDGNLTEQEWQELDACQAIIFGSPTYMGSVSWQFKKFADDSSKRWFEQKWKNKVAGGFTNSASLNGDKFSTMSYLQTFAMQHSMVWVGTGLMPSNKKSAARDDINWLGSFSGAYAQSPSDSSPEEAPTKGDIETAKLFGQRVAEITSKFNA